MCKAIHFDQKVNEKLGGRSVNPSSWHPNVTLFSSIRWCPEDIGGFPPHPDSSQAQSTFFCFETPQAEQELFDSSLRFCRNATELCKVADLLPWWGPFSNQTLMTNLSIWMGMNDFSSPTDHWLWLVAILVRLMFFFQINAASTSQKSRQTITNHHESNDYQLKKQISWIPDHHPNRFIKCTFGATGFVKFFEANQRCIQPLPKRLRLSRLLMSIHPFSSEVLPWETTSPVVFPDFCCNIGALVLKQTSWCPN